MLHLSSEYLFYFPKLTFTRVVNRSGPPDIQIYCFENFSLDDFSHKLDSKFFHLWVIIQPIFRIFRPENPFFFAAARR